MFDDPHPLDELMTPPESLPARTEPDEPLTILDTDIFWDADDSVAVALAALHNEHVAVITADETRGRRAELVRQYLDDLGRPDVPVLEGIDLGSDRFLPNLPTAEREPNPNNHSTADQMVDTVVRWCENSTAPIRWVGMGPMTNLAAILTRRPDVAERFTVTQMGGWLTDYRDKTLASHNFRLDPVAAGVALRMLPTPRLVLSEVTGSPHIRVTPDWAIIRTLAAPTAPAWARLMSKGFQGWFARKSGSWMHDPLTLSAALGLPFVKFRPEQIRIARDARVYLDPTGCPVEVGYDADYPAFLDWMHEILTAGVLA